MISSVSSVWVVHLFTSPGASMVLSPRAISFSSSIGKFSSSLVSWIVVSGPVTVNGCVMRS